LDDERAAFVVTDFLPSGPNAVRTAVELQPDGEYQERLFRQLERFDPAVEHLGTWHSHHCNGLQTLSRGDIEGYHRTVNKPAYRLDWFLASLVTRLPGSSRDTGWIDHFLFVRGDQEFYNVTNAIQTVELPSRFGHLITHENAFGTSNKNGLAERTAEETLSAYGAPWYESELGRQVLAGDKRALSARFSGDVVATKRGGAVTMTGRLRDASVAVTYPATANDSHVTVTVNRGRETVLRITADLTWRQLAFTAAFLAAESLESDSGARDSF
jgi:hypothetical protein